MGVEHSHDLGGRTQDHDDRANEDDDPERYTAAAAAELDETAFEGGPIGRRTFLQVAAAAGAAFTLPGTATADDVTDDAMTDVYEFAVNYSRDDYAAPTVLEFEDHDALTAFADAYEEPIAEDLDRPPKAVTRTEPTPAAHAHLTADEVGDVLEEIEGVTSLDFSPGSNPFWKLEGGYDDGVFPAVEEARNYASHKETEAAMRHLEREYDDRVNFERIGHGPGHENLYTEAEQDPRDVFVVEVTNDIQDERAFEEKEKSVNLVGIHGDERQGVEAGIRVIEEVAKGEAEDFMHLLDDVVLVFMFVNPDGWVVRKPHYEFTDDDGEQVYNFQRGNATGLDTNRQYPTIGWANPEFWPAEPEDTPEVRPDDEEGRGYHDMVPDALANVEHLRGYENVTFLVDFHGMHASDWFMLNLETNAPFDHDGQHELDQVNVQISEDMESSLGGIEGIQEDVDRVAVDRFDLPEDEAPYNPNGLFDYGTIYDCIGYQITGGFLGWAGQPEEWGGLGARTVAPEMAWANNGTHDEKEWKPYIVRHQTEAYRIEMRQYAEIAAAETEATVATGDADTAYVGSDILTRSSNDLSHTDSSETGRGRGPPAHARGTGVEKYHDLVESGLEGRTTATAIEETSTLAVRFHAHDLEEGTIRVRNPEGEVAYEIDLGADTEGACCLSGREHFYVSDPEPGGWSIECEGPAVEVDIVAIETDEEHEDPEAVFGYPQREYEVNPMQFFEDLEPFLEDGSIDELSVHHVRIGRLLRGQSGKRQYDNLVVSHAEGFDDEEYVAALEAFLEAGGNLVLTDTGVALLGALEVGDAAEIDDEDLRSLEVQIANLRDREFDHHLLTDIREMQQEMWKPSQIGYTDGNDSPATVIDEAAFEAAGGSVAGRMEQWEGPWDEEELVDEGVAAGSIEAGDGEITVLGSLLPPAQQTELHPFGMANYALSFMGHTLLCNALGFEQRRYYDGELIGTWGTVR
ncbi:M14 family zinc carboxypeptidase [Natronococcus sp.]|uniref:M14 family zinc carboxypeptidase n=1 Tax=Natronococcus sp. TaxID=35747 RepID=UPI0025D5F782|nr:M14 family zinc carboxypeptidase [Natronococcus sp.]